MCVCVCVYVEYICSDRKQTEDDTHQFNSFYN